MKCIQKFLRISFLLLLVSCSSRYWNSDKAVETMEIMFIQPFQKSIKGESFHKLGKFLEKDAKSSGPKCVATCEKIYEGVSWDKGEKNIKEFFAVIEKQINQGMENLGKIWSFPN